MRARLPLLLAVAMLLPSPRVAIPGEGAGRRAEPPAENVSYVPSDDPAQRKAFAAAEEAAAAGDALTAARTLQGIADGPASAVVAVGEAAGQSGVFESARVVAHHRVAALGRAVAAAYEAEFGPRAAEALRRGGERLDRDLVAEAFDRYAPTVAGRRAALLLADLALERGDPDEALGWLDRLEDLEATAAPEVADDLAPWRAARIAREARARAATPAAEARLRARLEGLPPDRSLPPVSAIRGGTGAAEVRPQDLRPAARAPGWPTAGGGPARAGHAGAVPDGLVRVAFEEFNDPRPAPPGEADERGRASRPSPWLPPRAVVSGDRLVVSDGRRLHVLSLTTHKFLTRAPVPLRPEGAAAPEALRGEEARHAWGLIEGFGLTIVGDDVYASVPAAGVGLGRAPGRGEHDGDEERRLADPAPWQTWDDAICAVRLADGGGTVRWIAGGAAATPGLPTGLRLVGTPLYYRGAVHVTGLRRTKSTADMLEAWHVALDPATGAARSAVFLGTGTPLRRRRADEAHPSGCTGAHGRVHLCTSLGIAAAVDARTGRTLWSYRYDRGRPDGADTAQRLENLTEPAPRRNTFVNQPPLVADGRLFLAPTDGTRVMCLSDRPRGRGRVLTRWTLDRTLDFRNLAVEHLAGVTSEADDLPATLVAVGQGYGPDPVNDPFTCVVAIDAVSGSLRWERALPFGGIPEPFGLATLAGGDVFVPSAKGIARYALADGADRPPVEAPPDDRDEEAYGNLVPIPGRGIVAVAASRVTFYLRPR